MFENLPILIGLGIFSGLLAGLFGIGGGTVLVPIIKTLGYSPVQAVATSSLAIIMTSASGTFQNWRMGKLNLRRVILLALPSLLTAQLGVWLASSIPPYVLLTAFACFLILNIFLSRMRKVAIAESGDRSRKLNPALARILTGGTSGVLAGLFGIGGGVILVPLQIVLLGEKIKAAIQTSLAVIVLTSISATIGHASRGNILWFEGIVLGIGGLIGAQVSSRFLPRLPDKWVTISFNCLLGLLSIYVFYQGYNSYTSS
ncbi:sulfite exporter TauE/SafE family protein [Myxosarcina sp. GI1(2024)]